MYGEHPNLLHYSQILNDIRPVFDGAHSDDLVGVVITHTLKLEYHSGRGREEIYIALDDADLEELGDAIARARSQSDKLGSFVKSAGLSDLSKSGE